MTENLTLREQLFKEAPKLHASLMRSWDIAEKGWFSAIQGNKGSFNSIPHLQNVEAYADDILSQTSKKDAPRGANLRLNPVDKYLLLASILFHDLGRTNPKCDYHGEESQRMLEKNYADFGIDSKRLASVIGTICCYHECSDETRKTLHLHDVDIAPYGVIRVERLAVLLTFLDELDGAYRRVYPHYLSTDPSNMIPEFRRSTSDVRVDVSTMTVISCVDIENQDLRKTQKEESNTIDNETAFWTDDSKKNKSTNPKTWEEVTVSFNDKFWKYLKWTKEETNKITTFFEKVCSGFNTADDVQKRKLFSEYVSWATVNYLVSKLKETNPSNQNNENVEVNADIDSIIKYLKKQRKSDEKPLQSELENSIDITERFNQDNPKNTVSEKLDEILEKSVTKIIDRLRVSGRKTDEKTEEKTAKKAEESIEEGTAFFALEYSDASFLPQLKSFDMDFTFSSWPYLGLLGFLHVAIPDDEFKGDNKVISDRVKFVALASSVHESIKKIENCVTGKLSNYGLPFKAWVLEHDEHLFTWDGCETFEASLSIEFLKEIAERMWRLSAGTFGRAPFNYHTLASKLRIDDIVRVKTAVRRIAIIARQAEPEGPHSIIQHSDSEWWWDAPKGVKYGLRDLLSRIEQLKEPKYANPFT